MDIQIPDGERRRLRKRKIIARVAVIIGVIVLLLVGLNLMAPAVSRADLMMGEADRGDVESTVSATGHVVPSVEIIVTSPVSSSIVELYCREGDEVEVGTPLLKLDLQTTEDEYRKINDQLAMKRNDIEQGRLNSETKLTDLEMRIRTKQMAADQLLAQVENERHLDSLGSGTGQRVREAELAYKTACLEIEQMRRQLANERKVEHAGARTRQLEAAVVARSLEEAARTLDDAKICSPIKGTVTWLNTAIGARIGAGEKMAIISDLTQFKVEAEVSEGHSDKISVGEPVLLRIGKNDYQGRVSNMTAKSNSGVVKFFVAFDTMPKDGLRAGQSAKVNVVYDLREDVVRIPFGSYYNGPGHYDIFVVEGSELKRRQVVLGDASAKWVEVKEGIKPGEEVIVSGFDNFKNKTSVKLK